MNSWILFSHDSKNSSVGLLVYQTEIAQLLYDLQDNFLL